MKCFVKIMECNHDLLFKNSDSETTKLDIDVQSPDEETGIQGGYYILLRDGG